MKITHLDQCIDTTPLHLVQEDHFGMDMDPLHLHICTVLLHHTLILILLLQEVTYLLFILCQVFILPPRMAHFLLAFPPCLLLDPQIQFHLLLPLHLTHQGWEWVHHQCVCLHLIMVIYLPGVLPLLDHVDQFLCMEMWTLTIVYHTHLHLDHLDLFHEVILFLILLDLWAHPHTTILIHMVVSLLLMDI